MRNNYILMADIIGSRKRQAPQLIQEFKEVVEDVNHQSRDRLLSPLTITLGDEFQGIAASLEKAAETIINVEEIRIQKGYTFKLRYVIYYGEIETEINPDAAYEMLGEGLTMARDMLEGYKKNKSERTHIQLKDSRVENALEDTFSLYFSIIDNWNIARDNDLIQAFWQLQDYKSVAKRMQKDISLMWRREKSLQINEYMAAKRLIHFVCQQQTNVAA